MLDTLRYHLSRWRADGPIRTNVWLWLARHVPRRLRYWVVIVETGDYTFKHPTAVVSEVTAMELLG